MFIIERIYVLSAYDHLFLIRSLNKIKKKKIDLSIYCSYDSRQVADSVILQIVILKRD